MQDVGSQLLHMFWLTHATRLTSLQADEHLLYRMNYNYFIFAGNFNMDLSLPTSNWIFSDLHHSDFNTQRLKSVQNLSRGNITYHIR